MQGVQLDIAAPNEMQLRTPPAGRGEGAGGASFARDLGEAIEAVDKTQIAADTEADKLAGGAGNLHEVALALDKADVAMRLATKVRNKVVDAYNEIMRMSI
jgi:flagellar hook-basal body complex protein FliE